MTLRVRWRQRVAVFVVLASGILALLLAGGGAAGAAPAPTPSVAPTPSAKPLQVTLPGLLTLTVDLPKVKLELLGGADRSAAGGRATAEPTVAATRSSTAAAPTSARPTPPRAEPTRAAPARSTSRAERRDSNGPGRAATVGDTRQQPERSASAAIPRPATPRAVGEPFQGMLRTGLPIWLLAGVVVMCGIGTVVVVRSAGRRSTEVRRPTR